MLQLHNIILLYNQELFNTVLQLPYYLMHLIYANALMIKRTFLQCQLKCQ